MANLETLQQYANKCADRLELLDHPVLRWHTKSDQCRLMPRILAHCHTRDSHGFPKGTICLNKRAPIWYKVSFWHNTIAHEVTHLAVKSPHGTPTFARQMVKLGVANYRERIDARSARKGHHHVWMSGWDKGYFKECHACHKRVYRG